MSAAYTNTNTLKVCAFLGATGGCANWALVLALKSGHQVTALARTPNKLVDMLVANGVGKAIVDRNLHIVQGDAKDPAAVKATIEHRPVDIIISGIGGDALSKNYKATQSTLCEDAAKTLVDVLRELNLEKKPFCAMISTTGISEKQDVPCLMQPLYHWLLATPHADKKAMEEVISEAGSGDSPVIDGWTFVRPALLTDRDEAKGPERWEVGTEEKPAVGYTIPRKDVGLWIYEKLIKGDVSAWRGAKPSLVAH